MHELKFPKKKYTLRTLFSSIPKKVAFSPDLRKELGFREHTRTLTRFLDRIVAGIHQENKHLINVVKNRMTILADNFAHAHGYQLDEKGYSSFFDLLNMLVSFEYEGCENKTIINYKFDKENRVVIVRLLNGGCSFDLPFLAVNSGDQYIARYREMVARFIYVVKSSSSDEVKRQVALMLGNIPKIYGTNTKDVISVYEAFKLFCNWYNELYKYRLLPNNKPNAIKMERKKEARGEYLLITSPFKVQFSFRQFKDRFECLPV